MGRRREAILRPYAQAHNGKAPLPYTDEGGHQSGLSNQYAEGGPRSSSVGLKYISDSAHSYLKELDIIWKERSRMEEEKI